MVSGKERGPPAGRLETVQTFLVGRRRHDLTPLPAPLCPPVWDFQDSWGMPGKLVLTWTLPAQCGVQRSGDHCGPQGQTAWVPSLEFSSSIYQLCDFRQIT